MTLALKIAFAGVGFGTAISAAYLVYQQLRSAFCKHDWGRWSEPEMVSAYVHQIDGGTAIRQIWVQKRCCLECNEADMRGGAANSPVH